MEFTRVEPHNTNHATEVTEAMLQIKMDDLYQNACDGCATSQNLVIEAIGNNDAATQAFLEFMRVLTTPEFSAWDIYEKKTRAAELSNAVDAYIRRAVLYQAGEDIH